jgi:tetratricopeptide (TPR) repeat protein
MANFAPLDRWLPEFERLIHGSRPPSRSRKRARASAAYDRALFRTPEDPRLEHCARRLGVLIDGEDDVNVRMMAASTLFNYLNWKTDGDTASGLVARIEPVVARPDVTPLMQVWWRTHLSFWHYINGRYDQSAAVIAEARAIAERYGLEAYLFEIDHAEVTALISKGELAAAKSNLEAMEKRLSPARRMDWAYFHYLRSMLEQRLSQYSSAVQDAERAIVLARETGLPVMQLPHFLARLAHSRSAAGDRDGGMRALDEAIALSSESERGTFVQMRELIEVDLTSTPKDAASDELPCAAARRPPRARSLSSCATGRKSRRGSPNSRSIGASSRIVRKLIEKNAPCAGRRRSCGRSACACASARRIRTRSRWPADAPT